MNNMEDMAGQEMKAEEMKLLEALKGGRLPQGRTTQTAIAGVPRVNQELGLTRELNRLSRFSDELPKAITALREKIGPILASTPSPGIRDEQPQTGSPLAHVVSGKLDIIESCIAEIDTITAQVDF